MSESIELPNDYELEGFETPHNDIDLAVYGFCGCGSPVYGQLMQDLYDCSGKLVCGLCLLGLHWKEDLKITWIWG